LVLWQNGWPLTKLPQKSGTELTTAICKGLPDRIRPGVRILFVGINPGLRSAQTGHHFAGYSNRFWKLLYDSQLVSEPLTYKDDARLPEWELGLTNIILRPSAGIAVLCPREYVTGSRRLENLLKRFRPRVVVLLGVTIYRKLFPDESRHQVRLGWQRQRLAGIRLYVLPNPSGRNAHYSYREMLHLFRLLKTGSHRRAVRTKKRAPAQNRNLVLVTR